jgi:hypothetical protein
MVALIMAVDIAALALVVVNAIMVASGITLQ